MKKIYTSKHPFRAIKNLSLLGLFSFFCVLNSYSQQTYTFTNCGATGTIGPTQSAVTASYAATNLSLVATTTPTSGIQTFTVPQTGVYRITAIGATSGTTGALGIIPGYGAYMRGEFSLTAGDVLQILVGQRGQDHPSYAAGGGGASFVVATPYNTISSVLVIAGGGGAPSGDFPGVNAVTAQCGTFDVQSGPAQCAGSGGLTFSGNSGGGGGGFLTDGQGNVTVSNGGKAYVNGGAGAYSTMLYAWGGFGGGGANYSPSTSTYASNGGGGFSGGNGGNRASTQGTGRMGGGGGGSYNSGANQTNSITTVLADGKVIIESLCNINLLGNGVANNVAICSGNSLTLTTSAVSNYTWSTNNTTNTMIVVSPTSSQTYSVIGTSTAACQSSSSISVTVNAGLPVLTITNTPNNICLGRTATLTAGGAISYTWAGGPGGIINGQTFTPTATSNYTVTGKNGCGTTTSVTTITISPLAVNAAASPSLSCSGNPVTLTVSSAVTGYTWTPGPITGSNVIVVPTVNTVYTVTASDGTCSGVAMVTINTKPNPTLTIVASTQTVCQGAAVTLTASGAVTYTWISPVSNSPNISDNPTTVTLYQVSGTNSVNCTSSASQLVFTQPSPTVVITANKNIVCAGDPATLTASGANSYNWTNGPATAGNVVNPSSNTTYTVTGTTTPCSGSKTITINVLPASVLASATTPSICNGASTSLHASGATSYTWVGQIAFSPGNANVSPTVTTIYTVSALTTSAGLSCPSSTNITVTVFNNPVVTIAASKSVVCKSDANVVLTGGGATTYTWSSASTPSANISVHPQSTTTYSVTGVDANGCMNTASQVITVNACTGIAELNNKENSISVYPNPSNGEFVVSADSEISLRLINELGQEIRTIKLSEQNNYKVSVTNLANGVYFIVGQNGNNKVNQKIVVAN